MTTCKTQQDLNVPEGNPNRNGRKDSSSPEKRLRGYFSYDL